MKTTEKIKSENVRNSSTRHIFDNKYSSLIINIATLRKKNYTY